jgi:hypothetical protein
MWNTRCPSHETLEVAHKLFTQILQLVHLVVLLPALQLADLLRRLCAQF